ncbi:MAG: SRPBCC family protein [Brachybacterium paraconglomeratum]|nr:SRPBCC family protein [Brachybacterium paraconglomeratum]
MRVAAPAALVWDYVTDWPRQAEWIPLTRAEAVPAGAAAAGVGERIRAWSGIGPVGFWDTMTITGWETDPDGSRRCEVLHTGAVVRGDGAFAVTPEGPGSCRFVWWERLDIPGGPVGALLWRLLGWTMSLGVDQALRRMARRAEAVARAGGRPSHG